MPLSASISNGQQAGTLLTFGIGTPEQSYGLVQDFTVNTSVQVNKWQDGGGQYGAIQHSAKKEDIIITYIPLVSGSIEPQPGDRVEFVSRSWIVSECSFGRVIDGFQTNTITAEWYEKALSGL